MPSTPNADRQAGLVAAEAVLPEPGNFAQVHSNKLRQMLIQRIESADGAVSFAEYMSYALYEPGFGYYMAGALKFGTEGDFITAPEVSPLFGAALAVQVKEVLAKIGGDILELGAGSGKLATAVFQALDDEVDFRYTILETSAELIQRQRNLLEAELSTEQMKRVNWIDTLPTHFVGVVIANEVMDALPVERFRVNDLASSIEQICVTPQLTATTRAAGNALLKAVVEIEADLQAPLPPGYQSEVCLLLRPWLSSLAQSVERGVILLIDYGYPRKEFYLPERRNGTLLCYFQHRAHDDPFFWPGLQDITAHVDFTRVAESALAAELELLGYATQSAFLLDNRLLELAAEQANALINEVDRIALAQAVKTLTLPGEMGERFQVMALGKGYDHALQGFATQDLSYRL